MPAVRIPAISQLRSVTHYSNSYQWTQLLMPHLMVPLSTRRRANPAGQHRKIKIFGLAVRKSKKRAALGKTCAKVAIIMSKCRLVLTFSFGETAGYFGTVSCHRCKRKNSSKKERFAISETSEIRRRTKVAQLKLVGECRLKLLSEMKNIKT